MSPRHDRSSASDAAPSVDVLSDVLRSVRLTGAMLFLVDAAPPWHSWAPRADAFRRIVLPGCEHIISYHVLTKGHCAAGLRGGDAVSLRPGDVLVVAHGDAYYLADPPEAAPHYGADDAIGFFRRMAAGELPSSVAEGEGEVANAQFVCGFLGCDARPFNPVLAMLPPLLHVRAAATPGDRMDALVTFALAALRDTRGAGSAIVLLRLAELMFVEVLRRHLGSAVALGPGWLAGLRQPLVARALARLHGDPARAWTLDALADAVGASRSVLAERFAEHVGQPPMHYLASWRMQLASRLLRQPGAKVSAVAREVGYGSEAAFSRAFKKRVGTAPADWRAR